MSNELINSLITQAANATGKHLDQDASYYLCRLVAIECNKIINDYIWQSNNNEAKIALSNVIYDLRNRFN
jgi:hypothetical protein